MNADKAKAWSGRAHVGDLGSIRRNVPMWICARRIRFAAGALFLLLAGCARRYNVEGIVLRAGPEPNSVLVSHGAVGDYMPAMTMPFRVREAREIEGVKPGMRVRFELVAGKRESFIRRLEVRQAETGIKIPEPPEKAKLGEAVPDFALTSHTGGSVRLSELRGKVVAVNFIYTRCPLPEVCPRLSANFAYVHRRFAARMGKDLALLSVTLDPQYDTVEVLARYARPFRPVGWHFLTGTMDEVAAAGRVFGMVWWNEEGVLAHTSATAIIGRDGRLAAMIEGSDYTGNQLADLIESVLYPSGRERPAGDPAVEGI
jgi:protein SCO1